MGPRLHGMARRKEQIELNRRAPAEVGTHDVLGRSACRPASDRYRPYRAVSPRAQSAVGLFWVPDLRKLAFWSTTERSPAKASAAGPSPSRASLPLSCFPDAI